MKAEIISVGSVLLEGQIANVNAQFLSKELFSLGIPVEQCTMVGDSSEKLTEAIKQAEESVDFIVISGGLGPSKDDITKNVISKHLDLPLVIDRETEDQIITYHKNSDFTMPDNNQLQALVLQNSTPIRNVTGLAAGMYFHQGKSTYLLLPGPFDELQPMFTQTVRPLIIEQLIEEATVFSRTLRLYGITEAQLTAKLNELVQYKENPVIAVYPDNGEVTIQITARAGTEEESEQKVEKIEEEIKQKVGKFVFGYGEDKLPVVVKKLLQKNDMKVTAAESLTGGAFLSALTSEKEASSIFNGGIVTYSSDMKRDLLGVTQKTINKFGVVSSQCAIEMAEKAMDMYQADIGVSLTGVAGPSSAEGEIPGTVWIGIAKRKDKAFAKQYHFAYKRNKNRNHAILTAMNLVRAVLLDETINKKVFIDEKTHGEETKEELQ